MKTLLALSLFAVLFIGFYFILSANCVSCAIFNWKERKLWRKFIKDYNNFKLLSSDNSGKEFISNCGNYIVIIWDNSSFIEKGLCSVHDAKTDDCILSTFDKRMSKILANKLLSKLNSNEGA
jgi:hypothetical protein